jgi:hypothetical protein
MCGHIEKVIVGKKEAIELVLVALSAKDMS